MGCFLSQAIKSYFCLVSKQHPVVHTDSNIFDLEKKTSLCVLLCQILWQIFNKYLIRTFTSSKSGTGQNNLFWPTGESGNSCAVKLWKYEIDKSKKCHKNVQTHEIFIELSKTVITYTLSFFIFVYNPVWRHINNNYCN